MGFSRQKLTKENQKENYEDYNKKHYTVKTREIKWQSDINIDESVEKTLSFLHIFIDNTVNEKLKHEKTLREYQRMMLSSVAHEFRNPLNAIKGNLMLIEMNQDPRIEKFVRVSKNSCLLLNSYVEDILDLGRIEGSAFQLNNEEFKIEEILQEVKDIFELEMKHRRIKFKMNIAPRFSIVNVYSDRDRLRQVVINLVSNAIKFCNSTIIIDVFQLFGGSDSEYSKEERKDADDEISLPDFDPTIAAKKLIHGQSIYGGDSVFVSVTDDGDGIAPQDQEKLFKLFGKIKKTHHRNKKGCGLGLTVCKKIMQKMNGDIDVISKRRKGTIFCAMFRSPNLDYENTKYDEYSEYVEDVKASLVYYSHMKTFKTF